MKKKKIIILVVTGLLVIGLGWFFIVRKSSKSDFTLQTTTLIKENIGIVVTATGTLEPITKIEVGTQVSGTIDKIYVDYNSEVKEGQVLAELDKVTLQSDLLSKEMELQSAKIEYDYQQINFNRIKDLYEQQLISKMDYEAALYNFDKAQTTYKRISSDLVKAQTNLSYAIITSPINGIVLSRAVEEGQTVAASFNTPTLFTIANDLTKMQVVANVDEADIGGVSNGQRVTFTVDAYPMDVFEGEVIQVRLEATVTSNVVTYEVLINAPNPDLKLKPGLTANVTIFTLEKNNVDVLPNRTFAYTPDPEILQGMGYRIDENPVSGGGAQNRRIWLLEGETLRAQPVVSGVTDGVSTEILSGISPSDIVVTGVSSATKDPASRNTETSPFMPQRGRRR
jgi:HlyD family secretion protein